MMQVFDKRGRVWFVRILDVVSPYMIKVLTRGGRVWFVQILDVHSNKTCRTTGYVQVLTTRRWYVPFPYWRSIATHRVALHNTSPDKRDGGIFRLSSGLSSKFTLYYYIQYSGIIYIMHIPISIYLLNYMHNIQI